MKKHYSKKFIMEALKYWKNKLNEYESNNKTFIVSKPKIIYTKAFVNEALTYWYDQLNKDNMLLEALHTKHLNEEDEIDSYQNAIADINDRGAGTAGWYSDLDAISTRNALIRKAESGNFYSKDRYHDDMSTTLKQTSDNIKIDDDSIRKYIYSVLIPNHIKNNIWTVHIRNIITEYINNNNNPIYQSQFNDIKSVNEDPDAQPEYTETPIIERPHETHYAKSDYTTDDWTAQVRTDINMGNYDASMQTIDDEDEIDATIDAGLDRRDAEQSDALHKGSEDEDNTKFDTTTDQYDIVKNTIITYLLDEENVKFTKFGCFILVDENIIPENIKTKATICNFNAGQGGLTDDGKYYFAINWQGMK